MPDDVGDVSDLLLEIALVLLEPAKPFFAAGKTSVSAEAWAAAEVSVSVHGSPPFFIAFEKCSDGSLRAAERLGPAVEQLVALRGGLVGALRGARELGAPLGADESFLLECPQEAVEVADVHPALDAQLRDPLEQLVPVQRALAQKQQQRRLDEPLDPRPDVPVARADEPPAAGAGMTAVPHVHEYR
jgi:hypothetical protein